MINEKYQNVTIGESKSYTVINNGNATSTVTNLYYEQLQEQSDGDWVEVVRCKDCQYSRPKKSGIKLHCAWWYRSVYDDDFCSRGKRRKDG